jgi:hypothetical protein
MCKEEIVVECGYETPKHGYCPPCASIRLDEIMSATLPPDELHIRATAHEAKHPHLSPSERLLLNGWWVQAPALGTVRAPVALAFAASIIRACDQIEAAQKTTTE